MLKNNKVTIKNIIFEDNKLIINKKISTNILKNKPSLGQKNIYPKSKTNINKKYILNNNLKNILSKKLSYLDNKKHKKSYKIKNYKNTISTNNPSRSISKININYNKNKSILTPFNTMLKINKYSSQLYFFNLN